MKLVRFGAKGKEKPGLIDKEGKLRDLSGVIADITPEQLAPAALARLTKLDPSTLPLVKGKKRFGVPLNGVRKFLAIGLNYSDHAAEAGMPIPKEPILFFKADTSLSGPNDDVMLPLGSKKSDWEVELGLVIGKKARYVSKKDALKHVAGYCVVNDISEREYQIERGGTWDKGKGCDTFGPVGPWLVTTDEIKDPHDLRISFRLNGETLQDSSTGQMIFRIPELIEFIAKAITLEPGDVIATGTPPGVGFARTPKIFLKDGDIAEVAIEGLGVLKNPVIQK